MHHRWIVNFILLALIMGPLRATQAGEPEWQSVISAVDPTSATAGEWSIADGELQVSAAAGARLPLPVTPPEEYDVRVEFTRRTGVHSIGILFVHGRHQCALEVDAWGEHLAGFQNLAGRDIRQNPTRKSGLALTNGQKYTLTLEVRRNRIRGLLDDREIANYSTTGQDLSLPDLWKIPPGTLGLAAWESDVTFHRLDVRAPDGMSLTMQAPDSPPSKSSPSTGASPSAPRPGNRNSQAPGKKVVIVIANRDFFYREYADPRAELERAGIAVTVAAGRKEACRPHQGSGEGADGGVVTPDITIAEIKAKDFDAILFSGGWGASMYQFAFNGRYNNPVYNGDRKTKAEVNRVINEFLDADKYTCALCNAVSVLAWARVDGKSPLRGKKVCAPPREAAAGIYNGRQAQPSCRWHPETNGAILSPAGAIGDPNSDHDDVLVDGRIITGENDPSAREMGRRLVEVLTSED